MSREYFHICKICGADFVSRSGHAYYCNACRPETLRIHNLENTERQKQKYTERARQKYSKGVIYICKVCERKIRVHARVNRSVCNECAAKTCYGRSLLYSRKDVDEEVVE